MLNTFFVSGINTTISVTVDELNVTFIWSTEVSANCIWLLLEKCLYLCRLEGWILFSLALILNPW